MKPFIRIDLLSIWEQAVETDGFVPDTHLLDALASVVDCRDLDSEFEITGTKVVALFASQVVHLEAGLPFIGEKLLTISAKDFVAQGYGNADDYSYEVESSGFSMAIFAVAHSLESTIDNRGILEGVEFENGEIVLEKALRLLAKSESSFNVLLKAPLVPSSVVWAIFQGGSVAEKWDISAPEHLDFVIAQKRLQGEL
jgi:hypothetical protein